MHYSVLDDKTEFDVCLFFQEPLALTFPLIRRMWNFVFVFSGAFAIDFSYDTKDVEFCVCFSGAFGIDFSFDTEDVEAGLQLVAKGILAHGVTSFCPTLVTSPPDFYKQVSPQLKRDLLSTRDWHLKNFHDTILMFL